MLRLKKRFAHPKIAKREQQEEVTRRGGETIRAVYCQDKKREKNDAGGACRKDSCDR